MEIKERIQALMYIVGVLVVVGCFFSIQAQEKPIESVDAQTIVMPKITMNYEYDAQNRLVAIHYSDGFHVRFSYNEKGEVIERKEFHTPKTTGESEAVIVTLSEKADTSERLAIETQTN